MEIHSEIDGGAYQLCGLFFKALLATNSYIDILASSLELLKSPTAYYRPQSFCYEMKVQEMLDEYENAQRRTAASKGILLVRNGEERNALD